MITIPWWVALLFVAGIGLQAHLMGKAFAAHMKMAAAYRDILADYFQELDKRAPKYQLGQPASLWLGSESLQARAAEMERDLKGES